MFDSWKTRRYTLWWQLGGYDLFSNFKNHVLIFYYYKGVGGVYVAINYKIAIHEDLQDTILLKISRNHDSTKI